MTKCCEKTFVLPWKQTNSTISKTFYTCSMESLLLRYKKISKKAVNIGGFLQCSVHIFLGYDGCFWTINLRILWNHIMKTWSMWQHHISQNIFFWKLLDLCLADRRILCFWQVLESIHKFMIEFRALQWFIVTGAISIKRGRGPGLFQIS